MDSNTHSAQPSPQPSTEPPDGLATLAAAVEELAVQDLDHLTDAALATQVLGLRRLLDRLEGHWLKELAGVDGRGAAGAEQAEQAASTAAWLRGRLRLGAGAAHASVRTARALFRGPWLPPARPSPTGPSRWPTLRCWPPAPRSLLPR
jgi:hypothetical protein